MKDEVVIADTNFDQVTRSGRIDDDISVEIMDRHGIAQSMVDGLSCEAALSCTFQEPDDDKLGVTHNMVGRQRLLPMCWSWRPTTLAEPNSGCQWLLA